MRILDRYILKNFLVNYLLALGVLVGMYILFDLIVNVQDFARGASVGPATSAPAPTGWDIASDMFDYYLYQLPVIFQQVSGIIPLLAAGFTMVRMTRHHELTAMLASGVSLYRVAAPIILVSMGFAVLNVANQELLISQPFVIEKLLRKHNEVSASYSKNTPLTFIKDTDQSLLTARDYYTLKSVPVTVKSSNAFSRPAGSGSFITDRIRKDMEIVVSGFANNENNGSFLVTDVTDDTLIVATNALREEPAASVSILVAAVEPKNDPLMFVKDSDGSLLSAREYYPLKNVSVSAHGPNTFTRPEGSGSFLADGVRKNMVIESSGFNDKGNNGRFLIKAVDDLSVTVSTNTLSTEFASADSHIVAGGTMIDVFIVYRDPAGIPIRHTLAETAHWEIPSLPDASTEAWVLRKVVTEDDVGRQPDARPLPVEVRSTGTLRPDQIDLILSRKAVDYLSSSRLTKLAESALDVNKPLLYKIMHLRFTQPLMNIILLLIGIPFLLTREPNRLVYNMFYCVAVTGFIFIATFVIFQMAGTQIKDPLLGTWLPVLIFGPFALVMLDFVQT